MGGGGQPRRKEPWSHISGRRNGAESQGTSISIRPWPGSAWEGEVRASRKLTLDFKNKEDSHKTSFSSEHFPEIEWKYP